MKIPAFNDLELSPNSSVIVIPPWADINRPALNAHILQSCCKTNGHDLNVVYANVLLASILGEKLYQSIAYAPQAALLGEGIFSAAAFDLPSIVDRGGKVFEFYLKQTSSKMKFKLTLDIIKEVERVALAFTKALAARICDSTPVFVGATNTFEQTSASLALLNEVKKINPEIITIVGGANCDGVMANGIQSLNCSVNYIFSGESEKTFSHFINNLNQYSPNVYNYIITGKEAINIEEIPQVNYAEYYRQRQQFLPIDSKDQPNIWLSYETSRGCWWGAFHHCTFCGLNAETMKHREKSPEKITDELKELTENHVSNSIWIIDNIMPFSYFKTLLPNMKSKIGSQHIYWDQKSNLTLEKVRLLKDSGVGIIQPGIESFSSRLLKRMDKGVNAAQNIKMLRYTRSLDLKETWNILFSFPGDKHEDYDEQITIMELIHHLQPPTWLARINIDRFSPYFFQPEKYGIENLQPFPAYFYTFPAEANIEQIAYHFHGKYDSAITADADGTLKPLCYAFDDWRYKWTLPDTPPPILNVSKIDEDHFLLIDTRDLPGTQRITIINREQARIALLDWQLDRVDQYLLSWALGIKIGLIADNRYVALATASYEVLNEFEHEDKPVAQTGDSALATI